LCLVVVLALAACSTPRPQPDPALLKQAAPATLASGKAHAPRQARLVWGGLVRSVHNLRERTRIEIEAYPLDVRGRPLTSLPATGRFFVEVQRFLEPREFPPGRVVSVQGRYLGLRDGLPLLKAERLDVWPPEQQGSGWRPGMSLGIGGGSRGVSVGVGLGVEIGL
jgi:outer membrane lipoprotein